MLETVDLFSLEPSAVEKFLARAELSHAFGAFPMAAFDGFPTAMLFPPMRPFLGSLHYMFFPPRAEQQFHHHPGVRYLVLLGDVAMHVHYSRSDVAEDPHLEEEVVTLHPHTLTAVRFPSRFWHSFRTASDTGRGVMAFSFHEDDDMPPGTVAQAALMEEETTFWEPPQR